mgnify:CR=1 FL=1
MTQLFLKSLYEEEEEEEKQGLSWYNCCQKTPYLLPAHLQGPFCPAIDRHWPFGENLGRTVLVSAVCSTSASSRGVSDP